jgi:hypothetical protein
MKTLKTQQRRARLKKIVNKNKINKKTDMVIKIIMRDLKDQKNKRKKMIMKINHHIRDHLLLTEEKRKKKISVKMTMTMKKNLHLILKMKKNQKITEKDIINKEEKKIERDILKIENIEETMKRKKRKKKNLHLPNTSAENNQATEDLKLLMKKV